MDPQKAVSESRSAVQAAMAGVPDA
jgi:hypothetical protein